MTQPNAYPGSLYPDAPPPQLFITLDDADKRATRSFVRGLIIGGTIVGALAYALPAWAHDWYPRSCCSDKDCWKAAADAVTATAGGWRVESNGEVIPYDDPRVRPTPPEGGGAFHTCHIAGDPNLRVLCLFVPEFGS